MRFNSLSDFEGHANTVAALADCPKNPDVRYGFVAIEKREKNRLDLKPELYKIVDLLDVEFVLQPISEDRGTAKRIRHDLCRKTGRDRFYHDCKLNKVENMLLDAKSEIV